MMQKNVLDYGIEKCFSLHGLEKYFAFVAIIFQFMVQKNVLGICYRKLFWILWFRKIFCVYGNNILDYGIEEFFRFYGLEKCLQILWFRTIFCIYDPALYTVSHMVFAIPSLCFSFSTQPRGAGGLRRITIPKFLKSTFHKNSHGLYF